MSDMPIERLDRLLGTGRATAWHGLAVVVMLFLVGFIGWAIWAQIDEVAVATGEVKPQGRIKVIQHLEGGIIEEILVSEGDAVQVGDVLLRLDLATEGINRNDLLVQLDGLLLKRERLKAEVEDRDPLFPPELVERRPILAASEAQIMAARGAQHRSTLNVVEEQIRQRENELLELDVRRKAIRQDLALARKQYAMSENLLKDGLTSEMEHLELERGIRQLDGEIKVVEQAIPRVNAAIKESRARLSEEGERFRNETIEELSKTELSIARTREMLDRATDQVRRADIRSTIAGVVKNMRYNTIGGVIRPGEPIMDIVPSEESLIVEARLNPVDRGYVRVGQEATVKVSTYDFIRYGSLEGSVSQISADTLVDQSGAPYYRVIVTTNRAYLGEDEGSLPITPGMQATVDIHTGSRSVASYLIKPVLKLRHEAFRER